MSLPQPLHKTWTIIYTIFCLGCTGNPASNQETTAESASQQNLPNIIFILADDLGYGDVGAYGQSQIQTPHIDQLAREGIRFTQFYAGATVCAPSRSVLMTGQHTGHTRVRGNAGRGESIKQSLQPEDTTLAELLKKTDYQTGLVGKWGLGEIDEPGMPLDQGFDTFFGYLNQKHAHNYYPAFLWRNRDTVHLQNVVPPAQNNEEGFGVGYATQKVAYSHDLFVQEALDFIQKSEGQPFFLYLALTIPHANNEAGDQGMEVPEAASYAQQDWPENQKNMAAMVTRMDSDIGKIMEALKNYGIEENTIVFFTSDNGPHHEGGNDPDFFDSNGPLRGTKRDLYEGGIRVPFIVRWPGHTPAGTTSDHVGYFGDMMATFADIAGVTPPEHLQSISIYPTLQGKPEQQQHDYLYWEFYEQGSKQAVRMGQWKGIRQPMFTGEIELYNLEEDLGEQNNVANQHPDVVAKIEALMEEAHEPSPLWAVKQ